MKSNYGSIHPLKPAQDDRNLITYTPIRNMFIDNNSLLRESYQPMTRVGPTRLQPVEKALRGATTGAKGFQGAMQLLKSDEETGVTRKTKEEVPTIKEVPGRRSEEIERKQVGELREVRPNEMGYRGPTIKEVPGRRSEEIERKQVGELREVRPNEMGYRGPTRLGPTLRGEVKEVGDDQKVVGQARKDEGKKKTAKMGTFGRWYNIGQNFMSADPTVSAIGIGQAVKTAASGVAQYRKRRRDEAEEEEAKRTGTAAHARGAATKSLGFSKANAFLKAINTPQKGGVKSVR